MNNNYQQLFDNLSKAGIEINDKDKKNIIEKINQITAYKPKVGFLGKTGVGKSSLANALFGQELFEVNDVEACTRKIQEESLYLTNDKNITLLDVPGVGENSDRDKEYSALYQKLLPELDVILWVLKADDRAYTSDERFYKHVVKPHIEQGKPIFFVLNQVDKIEPFREWDVENCQPGKTQLQNIQKKVQVVSQYFDVPLSKVIPVSANEKYNLVNLVKEIVYSLPKEKVYSVVKNIKEEYLDDEIITYAKKSTVETVVGGALAGAALGGLLLGPIGAIGGALLGGFFGSLFD